MYRMQLYSSCIRPCRVRQDRIEGIASELNLLLVACWRSAHRIYPGIGPVVVWGVKALPSSFWCLAVNAIILELQDLSRPFCRACYASSEVRRGLSLPRMAGPKPQCTAQTA